MAQECSKCSAKNVCTLVQVEEAGAGMFIGLSVLHPGPSKAGQGRLAQELGEGRGKVYQGILSVAQDVWHKSSSVSYVWQPSNSPFKGSK